MKHKILLLLPMLLTAMVGLFTSCDDDDDSGSAEMIVMSEAAQNQTVSYDVKEVALSFTARSNWTATVKNDGSEEWITIYTTSGVGGAYELTVTLKANSADDDRTGTIVITCGGQTKEAHITQQGSTLKIMDKADIPNYDKYYCPNEFDAEKMLRSDYKWSWFRMKQSEHFFVFWEAGFGDDPNSESVPSELRVDIDDLLEKAEQFYTTNIEKLGMATLGQGKSVLDDYKMEIYLLYQTEWLATGSGYDDKIGALWVNPSTCQPVGSTIGHEIGHSFQYQVSADKIYAGEAEYNSNGVLPVGFRYGFGANGDGGCAFWEQCAQWQSFQDYPQEAFTQDANVQVWLQNHHRHFNHEWQRYASYWFQYYYTEKHGIDSYARIWKESKYPEDPVQTFMRLYCDNDLDKLYDEMYDYSAHCANYDFSAVHEYITTSAVNYSTTMYRNSDGAYQVAYANCPGTTGFNLIALNVPDAGTSVTANLTGLTPGSALASGDPGAYIDGDGNVKGNKTTYNSQANKNMGFRYGYVAVLADGSSDYGEMQSGTSGSVSYTVPANVERLYLCVMAAPATYNRNPWDDDETTDEQWPYQVSFESTDLLGNVDIPDGDPEDVSLSHEISLDYSSADYLLHTYNLLSNGDMTKIAQAFKLQPAEIASATLASGSVSTSGPADGQVAIALTNADGSLSYAYSANGTGFWIDANGDASSWGTAPVYFEYTAGSYSLAIGHNPGKSVSGTAYTIRPTMVYNKGGQLYKAVISVKMQF